MAFSTQFLDELRTRSSLPEIVGKRVKLIKKGREWHGLCPFHNEKTPSFTVNDEKGFYHCFGCGEHGSAFDFLMKTEGLSFPESIERLALSAGMDVPQDTPEERQRAERRKTLEEAMDSCCSWFESSLWAAEGREALSYLKNRGLSDETIKSFRLGFAPNSRNALKQALISDALPESLLVEGGMLITPPEDRQDRTPYDRFRGRVMFPIMNRRGRVIAFGGRILGDGEPKYLNSPETPIFHKGQVLYGLGQALPNAHKSGRLIVTEGYMDVIALHMSGFKEAVAPLGTALTEDHLTALWRVVREPILCFDGDNAGQRAASRAAERCLPMLKSGYGLRFAVLPPGEDPDTLVRSQGVAAMQAILDNTLPLSEVLWRMEAGTGEITTPEERASLQQRLGDHARRIEDPTIRSHFAAAFKDRIWQKKGNQGQQKPYKSQYGGPKDKQKSIPGVTPQKDNQNPETRQLEILLATLITHPSLYDDVGEQLGSLSYQKAGQMLDNLRQEVLKNLAIESSLDYLGLADHLKTNGFTQSLDALLTDRVYNSAFFARPEAELRDAQAGWIETLKRMQGKDLDTEIREAQREWEDNMSEENWARLQNLQQQKLGASADRSVGA